VSYPGW